MRKPAFILLFVACAIAPMTLRAQSALASQPVICYHYGDNPAWAAPSLDDSQWTKSVTGVVPAPPANSDGFLWVRLSYRISSSAYRTSSLTLRLAELNDQPSVAELFAGGSPIGHWGAPPPHPQVWFTPPESLFRLENSVTSGSAVSIAARLWVAPQRRGPGQSLHLSFSIEPTSTAVLADGYMRQKIFLADLPGFAICFFVALLGMALAGVSLAASRRILVLSAILLISLSAAQVFFSIAYSGLEPLTGEQYGATYFILILAASLCLIEFIWESLALGCRPVKYLAFVGAFLNSAAVAIAWVALVRRPAFLHVPVEDWGDYLRNLLELGGALWGLAFRPGRRALAAVLVLAGAVPTFLFYFDIGSISIGSVSLPVLSISLLLVGCCVAGIMAADAWSAWRHASELQFQFSAARELQQRLVPLALPEVSGMLVEAAYLPASEVGGDFYQVFQYADVAVLIVVGDVSGKGLKAAMTGILALGALRNMTQEALSPSQILFRLNAQLAASSDGGFVTCLCARIAPDGTLTVANAGHLPPYLNGKELSLPPALPLGVSSDAEYGETTLHLAPHDTLTLLSDGVVEAQSPTGELFGFDRTRSISTQSAEAIAAAAQAFGQQDDITVLTLTFAPAEVVRA